MSDAVATRSARPFLRRALRGLALALLVLSPLLLLLLVVEPRPRVVAGPPDAAAAQLTSGVVRRLQDFVATDGAGDRFSVDEATMDAVLASAQRLKPGLYGRATVGRGALGLEASAGAPILPDGLWLNLRLGLAPSEDGLRIASARIGKLPVPPALAAYGLRLGLRQALGQALGDQALASIAALRLVPPEATVAFDFGPGREAFFEALKARALAGAGKTAREQVYVQLYYLDRGARNGALPRDGSLLPYLERAARVAARQRTGEDREEMRGALYALALYCGDPDFGSRIGVTTREELHGAANGCSGTRLAGRDDLKRHFVISAGLYAATAQDSAFGMGELKELLDSNAGGSGFSFADMVADAAGVRFARTMLAAPRSDWVAMLAAVESDADLLPSLDGLPEGLGEADFRARFRDVDSPEYAAMVAEIEARVDALPFYRDAPAE